MAQSLSKVYLHIVFNTKGHKHKLRKEDRSEIYNYIGGILKNNNSQMVSIGGTANHIHILTTLPRTISMSKIMQRIKGNSSRWLKEYSSHYSGFEWQRGYGIFSVSSSMIKRVNSYINNQEKHHQQISYREELVGLLDKHEVEYDERFLWD